MMEHHYAIEIDKKRVLGIPWEPANDRCSGNDILSVYLSAIFVDIVTQMAFRFNLYINDITNHFYMCRCICEFITDGNEFMLA